ncbi:MAG: aromatic-L-amino-acid decarboxylase [Thermonema sp.]|uniref:pyridoxal phosphate-dependent decarboxylase family protein n=1 Tax=Thermonema sp. TaxID=2231181 RepID=UPI0021DD1FCA|nr:aminotransferase class I/II-fold pyridoxal phosphate-dependent enzyme [Thermonema sp.]GIV38852.1 MAG: aromatic-L-amino-acid decarboxylase [Thermonema sp.]
MKINDFREHAHRLVDWMADYLEHIEQYPVKSKSKPGELLAQLPGKAPQKGEPFEAIFKDFQEKILPGITHWQHPSFFAYFPANASPPSVLAEMLMATLGVQGMVWETSPAATELEERVMQWLRDACGLPSHWHGVIQDTASTASLCAILSARERATGFQSNESGLYEQPRLRIYASEQTHSSIEKDVKIAGLGKSNLVYIPTDERYALRPDCLRQAIEEDLQRGYRPMMVVANIGTTGSTAIDPLADIAAIARQYDLWLHVDAAYAGTACLLPEHRYMIDGIEQADSYVFNPHKWMLTNFDCSAYYVSDKETLLRTFSILPEYLKTGLEGQVNNYRDWGIALGRRFRALKLWFVLRSYGIEGLQQILRRHIALARWFKICIEGHPEFELMAPVPLNLVCFRYHPQGVNDVEMLNKLNESLLQRLNAGGKLYMSHTKLQGQYVLRFVCGQTYVQEQHVQQAWQLIEAESRRISKLLSLL